MEIRVLSTTSIFTVLLYLFVDLNCVTGLDPAAYANPSGQLTTEQGDPYPIEYQERYTIVVPQRDESCFFLENMKIGYIVSIHYVVVSSQNGHQLDTSFIMKDPKKRMVTFQARKKEGHYVNYKVAQDGDYEICFINKYSMYASKKIMWEVDIEGDELDNIEEVIKEIVNKEMEVFDELSEKVMSVIKSVRLGIAKSRHQQYWLKSKGTKDIERMEAIQGMVDRWSTGYSFLVFTAMIAQIVVLRSFFNTKPTSTKFNMRT